MITRTYHYYATRRDENGVIVSYKSGMIAFKTWLPVSGLYLGDYILDLASHDGRDGENVVIHNLSRVS